MLSVPLAATIPLLGTILPDKNFLTTILLNNGGLYLSPRNCGLPYFDILTVSEQKDVFEFDLFTDFIRQLLDTEAVALFGAVLPATTFNDSVHDCYLQKEPAYEMPAVVIVLVCRQWLVNLQDESEL
jgi:hypothetical protein